jgi:CelD/BcsL family acetyltransferase involved in cellulose biosynthesis
VTIQVTSATPALDVTLTDVDSLTDPQLAEWSRLFDRQQRPANPFLAPGWVVPWYITYVPAPERLLLFVRDAPSGALIGVAPFYRQRLRVAGVPVAHRLSMVGGGLSDSPLELPGLLTSHEHSRRVVREVAAATLKLAGSWSVLTLSPAQCWFEPEWVHRTGGAGSFVEAHRPRACVILHLGRTWEETRSGLKRNVKESIRRSHNRLRKQDLPWRVVPRSGDDLDGAAVDRFLRLHRARANSAISSVQHHDAYADERHRQFLRGALPDLARQGLVTLFELELDGRVVASQLALHGPGISYVHSSGFEPEVWDLGAVTVLHTSVIQHAVSRGDDVVNFSPGPNVSKLRWSEELWVANDFAYGAGSRDLRVRYALFSAASTLRKHVSQPRKALPPAASALDVHQTARTRTSAGPAVAGAGVAAPTRGPGSSAGATVPA